MKYDSRNKSKKHVQGFLNSVIISGKKNSNVGSTKTCLKIVLVGSCCTGKTSLLSSLIRYKFPLYYQPTLVESHEGTKLDVLEVETFDDHLRYFKSEFKLISNF